MYSNYFRRALVFGMDILPTPKAFECDPQITHYSRDAYTVESVEMMRKEGEQFTLIVDDGPHTLDSQIWFCKNYPALLAPDGIAIVEDIQDEKFLKPLFGAVPPGFNGMAIDLRAKNGRFDDLILVIWPKI